MFTEALFTTKMCKQRKIKSKSPPMDLCINKMWYINTTEYYSAFQRDEILYMVQHEYRKH